MSDLPEPLTPAGCDLRDFGFMPLDCARLLDSSLFARSTGDEFKAAVALWCKAWGQVPAGSLPDDARDLAHLSGAGARWGKVKVMALSGWVKCSDGRLYHPVVAEKANGAWGKKQAQRERSRKGNAARWGTDDAGRGEERGNEPQSAARNVPGGMPAASPGDPQAILEGCLSDPQAILQGLPSDPKGEGEGEGREKRKKPLTPSPDGDGESVDFQNEEGRPAGWVGQWKGLRANGSNPRAVAAAAEAEKPPPPEPSSPLWPAFRDRGMSAVEFGASVGRLACVGLVDGRERWEAPSDFLASHLRAEHGPAIERARGQRVEIVGPVVVSLAAGAAQ